MSPALQVAGPGAGAKSGMPCTLCPHMGCQHSFLRKGVTPCPECDAGTVVLDPVSGPKWRLDCNLCSFMIYLPETLHAVKLSKERCQVRRLASNALEVRCIFPFGFAWAQRESVWACMCWCHHRLQLSDPGVMR